MSESSKTLSDSRILKDRRINPFDVSPHSKLKNHTAFRLSFEATFVDF